MKMRVILSAAVLGTLILGSCGTSNDVVGGGILQKRKYNKGFYWNRNANTKDSETVKNEEVKASEEEYVVMNENTATPVSTTSAYSTVESVGDIASVNENEIVNTQKRELTGSSSLTTTKASVNSTSSTKKINVFKAQKQAVNYLKKNTSSPASDVATIVLVILAILIPPLAVFLFEGVTSRFWIDLILAILGWGAYGIFHGMLWICGLVAVIYALLIVLNVI